MSNNKVKRVLPEDAIVHAYRTTPASSRDLAAQYQASVNTIQAILRAHIPASTIKNLGYIKGSRKQSQIMQTKWGTNRPPRSEES